MNIHKYYKKIKFSINVLKRKERKKVKNKYNR